MKPSAIFLAAIFGWNSLCQAQSINSQQTSAPTTQVPSSKPYAIASNDANSRVWQKLNYSKNRKGQFVTHVLC